MKKHLKLHPLSVMGCLVSMAALGMMWHENYLPGALKSDNHAMNIAPTIELAKPVTAAISHTTSIATTPELNLQASIQIPKNPDPALTSLMQAIVLQSLESGVYTLATLPSELKPFAPRQFGRNTVANSEDEIQATTQETIPVIDEDKFAELSADDYVPPEPEFKCPDPYDLPPHMRNSHNIEAIKARGCEVYMEDQQVQAQPQEPEIINDETAMYESSI